MAAQTIDYGKLENSLTRVLQELSHLNIPSSRVQVGKRVTSGGFGDVFSGTLQKAPTDGGSQPGGIRDIAIKQFRPYGTRDDCVRVAAALAREMRTWSTLSHPNLLKLVGYCVDSVDYTMLWVITDWQSFGDIPTYIKRNGADELKRLELALDIAKGLAFLHAWTPPIYHADVKPANTLVNECERGMLCDFGLSKALDDTPSGLTTTKVNFTIRYASPELLLHTTQSISNDTWAWGCFLLETVCGIHPYESCTTDIGIFTAHARGQPPVDANTLDVPQEVKNVLAGCWKPAAQRVSMPECTDALSRYIEVIKRDEETQVQQEPGYPAPLSQPMQLDGSPQPTTEAGDGVLFYGKSPLSGLCNPAYRSPYSKSTI